MLHNGPFVRKGEEPSVDPAVVDPACVEWSLFGKNEGWRSNKKSVDPVVPRIETHSFDPYNQARPDLYSFQRDTKEALTYYSQARKDGKFVGTVETTSGGKPRESVLRIFWKKNGGADLEFDMMGDRTDKPPVCSGYCKKTDLGAPIPGMLGKLGWVVVATKLQGEDIRRSQTEHLFSLPLFEAIATAVAFGIFSSDSKIRTLYPVLGTMAPAAVGDMADSIHGSGNERWMRIDASDVNPHVQCSTRSRAVDLPGVEPGKGVEVTSLDGSLAIGAVFPLLKNNNALADGLTINKILVGEKCVSYKDYPEAKGICRFIVQAYSNQHANGTASVCTLDISPLAYADSNGRLKFESHMAKPMLGTEWIVPGRQNVTVTETEVELATTEIAPWDQKLTACIEKAMYDIRTGSATGVVSIA